MITDAGGFLGWIRICSTQVLVTWRLRSLLLDHHISATADKQEQLAMPKTTHALLLGRLGVRLSKYSEAEMNRVCLGGS